MLTGDGYLVRLHFSCGILNSEQARGIADLASRYGNGLIDLTRRANLQIRGVSEERIGALQGELLAGGVVAPHYGPETPNVIASPLAGRDCEALADIRPLVVELETRLARDPQATDLPAKFCFTVDDGGYFSLRDVAADVAFEACARDKFGVRIGSGAIGSVDVEHVVDTALALAAAFLALSATLPAPARRMRDIVDAVGISQVAAACAWLRAPSAIDARAGGDHRTKSGNDAVGLIADDVLGIAAPFGSLSADQLRVLADMAARYADGELRLTPWRAVLIPAIASGAAAHVQEECARAGLITDPTDPRRHIAACSGAPACASASVETRALATKLAPLLRPGETLHISGCAKSCASSSAATFTFVGSNGRFDLVRDGRPGDAPVLSGLSPRHAHMAMRRLTPKEPAHV